MNTYEHIMQFCDYFLKELNTIKIDISSRLYKKILYVTVLDTLARAAYPDSSNRSRFISFVDNYSDWSYKNKIGFVNLFYILKERKSESNLSHYITSNIVLLREGQVYRPDIDQEITEVEQRVGIINESEKQLLQKCRYSELLYLYRCKLIHEFREPAYPIEFNENDIEPYYHSYVREVGWQLVFPTGFFQTLCKNCLDRLKQKLITNNINPFTRYEFGNFWHEKKHILDNKKINKTT